MASLKKVLKKKKYKEISLKKMATHHLELKVRLNGVKGRFILDTGASNSCVGIEHAALFHLSMVDSETKAAGAGAVDMETKNSMDNTLKLGDWTSKKTHLVLFDMQHVNTALEQHNEVAVHGIIGADVLEKGKAVIDYKKMALYLKS